MTLDSWFSDLYFLCARVCQPTMVPSMNIFFVTHVYGCAHVCVWIHVGVHMCACAYRGQKSVLGVILRKAAHLL